MALPCMLANWYGRSAECFALARLKVNQSSTSGGFMTRRQHMRAIQHSLLHMGHPGMMTKSGGYTYRIHRTPDPDLFQVRILEPNQASWPRALSMEETLDDIESVFGKKDVLWVPTTD